MSGSFEFVGDGEAAAGAGDFSSAAAGFAFGFALMIWIAWDYRGGLAFDFSAGDGER